MLPGISSWHRAGTMINVPGRQIRRKAPRTDCSASKKRKHSQIQRARKSKLVKNSGRIPNRDIQKPISTGKRPMLIWIRFRFMGCTSFLYSKIIVTERPIACNEML